MARGKTGGARGKTSGVLDAVVDKAGELLDTGDDAEEEYEELPEEEYEE